MRWDAQQKVIDIFTIVPIVFGQDVLLKDKNLIQYESNIKDVCAYHEDIDNIILEYQRKTIHLINSSIEKDRKIIEKLK